MNKKRARYAAALGLVAVYPLQVAAGAAVFIAAGALLAREKPAAVTTDQSAS